MASSRLRRALVATTVAAAALTLTGCLQNPDAGGGGGLAEDAEPKEGDGTVTVLGAFGGQEEQAFLESVKEFEDSSGIDVQYVPDKDFATTILLKVNSGDAPDIGLFPQPGGVEQMVEKNAVIPIDRFLDYDTLDSTLIPGFLDAARVNGRVFAAPMRMAVKSIGWYPKEAYDEGGWSTEPADLDELAKVADQIRQDTDTPPWCIGWEDAQATGWVGMSMIRLTRAT